MSIFQIDRRTLSNLDLGLLGLAAAVSVLGIINLSSAASVSALWKTQMVWLTVGLAVVALVMVIDYRRYYQLAPLLYLACLGLLAGLHYWGRTVSGSTSWYDLGFARFQPSELTKIALILMFARVYERRMDREAWGFRDLLWPGLLVALPIGCVLAEPDMGTALVMMLLCGAMLLFAGIKRRVLVGGLAAALILASTFPLWKSALKPHHRNRIEVFLHPEKDPLGAGYNALQSKIAIGSGGLFGKGYKQGNVHMLRFLPEQHTDFVFSVWAEEWGLFWVAGVLVIYGAIIIKGLIAAQHAKDRFGVMLAVGGSALLFWHVVINVSMAAGLFPVIGVPLPFMSYGGSSLASFCIAVGLILNVRMRKYFF